MAKITLNNKKSFLPPFAVLRFLGGSTTPITSTGESYTVQLDGLGSNDPDGTIVNYQWERKIGNGSWQLQKSTTVNKYSQAIITTGIYKYRLKVTDNENLTDYSSELTVNFTRQVPNNPIAIVNGTSNNINYNGTQINYTLDGNSSTAESGQIVSYTWEVLSGNTTSYRFFGENNHTATIFFTRPPQTGDPSYNVVLKFTVLNSEGLEDSLIVDITVTGS